MRGIAPALPLTVNDRLRNLIEKESKKVSISSRFKKRLNIIVDGINGKAINQTVRNMGLDYKTVKKWRTRWNESVNMLIELSENGHSGNSVEDYELLKKINVVLSDKKRSGTPKQISLEQEEQIRVLACTRPKEHGIEMINWTHEMLAHVAISKGIVDKISGRYVGTILKKTK
jgi:transposase